jgi:hypothetical protein
MHFVLLLVIELLKYILNLILLKYSLSIMHTLYYTVKIVDSNVMSVLYKYIKNLAHLTNLQKTHFG